MEEKAVKRSRWFNIRVSQDEYQQLEKQFKKTSFQKMSEYGRSLLLGKPVTVIYRNRSMDDTLEELIVLRRELNAIGNNLNQAVKNLNSSEGTDKVLWMNLMLVINGKLTPSIQEMKDRMNQYADLWSLKSKAGKASGEH